MNKFKILMMVSIIAALTLSCQPVKDDEPDDDVVGGSSSGGNSGGGSSSGSNSGTTYNLVDSGVDGDGDAYFAYSVPGGWELCEEGVYSPEDYEHTIYYSIDNKKMTWGLDPDYSIQFSGTSNELIGTWTRTKSKCELVDDYYYGESMMYCRPNYDVTKAVFTDATVAITRQICPTDDNVDGSSPADGWTLKVKDCNTLEVSNGSDKIAVTQSNDGGEKTTYKGKSCELSVTKAKKQAACKTAWEEWEDGDYMWILNRDYNECLEGILPEEFFYYGGDDCWYIEEEYYCGDECLDYDEEDGWWNWCEAYYEYYGKISAKPALKAAKAAKSAITKAKPAVKAPKAAKAKTAKANKYSKFFNKKK